MASCWNLKGVQSPFDGKTHVPCNMTAVEAGGHSTCCPIGDLCLTNGMCLNKGDSNKKNWYWRTACTDKDWKDPACPRFCEKIGRNEQSDLLSSTNANGHRTNKEHRPDIQLPQTRLVVLRVCWR